MLLFFNQFSTGIMLVCRLNSVEKEKKQYIPRKEKKRENEKLISIAVNRNNIHRLRKAVSIGTRTNEKRRHLPHHLDFFFCLVSIINRPFLDTRTKNYFKIYIVTDN